MFLHCQYFFLHDRLMLLFHFDRVILLVFYGFEKNKTTAWSFYLPHLQRNDLHSVSWHWLGSTQLSQQTEIVSASQRLSLWYTQECTLHKISVFFCITLPPPSVLVCERIYNLCLIKHKCTKTINLSIFTITYRHWELDIQHLNIFVFL